MFMNAKKVQLASNTKNKQGKGFFSFIASIRQELKQVTWTTKDELRTYTKVVLGATFTFGMFFYIADLILRSGLHGLNSFIRLIGG